jgi:hypothetical protein
MQGVEIEQCDPIVNWVALASSTSKLAFPLDDWTGVHVFRATHS